ncbi:MAG TPA: GNAT family N-acetyltransferase [Acidimicrobiales bacterium]|nr:GNAT family N-acetyltransferase [Acidimicrobiales bacterium]
MIELIEKRQDELVHWIPAMIAGYVEQRIGAGESRESAWTNAEAQREQLFPGGTIAEGQHVMNLVLDGRPIGVLWMGRPLNGSDDTWFVFYVEVEEPYRGQGLGRAAMEAAEAWSKAHGGQRIALNVFGPNLVARSLYDSLGYQVMATSMFKDL